VTIKPTRFLLRLLGHLRPRTRDRPAESNPSAKDRHRAKRPGRGGGLQHPGRNLPIGSAFERDRLLDNRSYKGKHGHGARSSKGKHGHEAFHLRRDSKGKEGREAAHLPYQQPFGPTSPRDSLLWTLSCCDLGSATSGGCFSFIRTTIFWFQLRPWPDSQTRTRSGSGTFSISPGHSGGGT
jgi:hypothetical protein